MMIKIVIFIDKKTGEIYFYVPDEGGEALLVEPRIKKKDGETKEDEKTTH